MSPNFSSSLLFITSLSAFIYSGCFRCRIAVLMFNSCSSVYQREHSPSWKWNAESVQWLMFSLCGITVRFSSGVLSWWESTVLCMLMKTWNASSPPVYLTWHSLISSFLFVSPPLSVSPRFNVISPVCRHVSMFLSALLRESSSSEHWLTAVRGMGEERVRRSG